MVVSNFAGAAVSSNALLTVWVPVTIVAQPTNETVIQGIDATLWVTATGTMPLCYQWWFNGTNLLAGATNAWLTVPAVQLTNVGAYSVIVSNTAGAVASSNALLTVLVPPTITTQPANQMIVQGGTVTCCVTAVGTTPLSYQWWFNGNPLTNGTSSCLTITNLQLFNAGAYFVVVSNAAGSVASTNAISTVMIPPTITVLTSNQTVLPGSNVSFTVSATGDAPLNYQWYFNSAIIVNATNAALTIYNAQPTNAGNFCVIVTNLAGSTTSSNSTLTIMSWTADSDYDGRSDGQEIVDGTDPSNPNSVLPVRLGSWHFDNTNTWAGAAGQLPLQVTNLVGISSFDSNAVLVDSANPAILKYRDVETNGNANINLRSGSVRFWFKPDWSSANASGIEPGFYGRLIEMGKWSSNLPTNSNQGYFTNGWWSLYFDPHGTNLTFASSTNGMGGINLTAPVSVISNQWYQFALAYTPTNSILYLNSQAIASGIGSSNFPNALERAGGFCIGSDLNGTNQAKGAFDDWECFNYPLASATVSNDFHTLTSVVITVQPTNQVVDIGSNCVLSIVATSPMPLHYQWWFNTTNLLSGATNANLTLNAVQATNAGNYSVVVTNNYASVNSSNATLMVLTPGAPTILSQPAGRTAQIGDDVFFVVGAVGMPNPSYQWYFNGAGISGATNSTWELDGVNTNNIGGYYVTVSNIYGSVVSQTAYMTNLFTPSYYVVLQGSLTNFIVAADTTYYIDSTIQLYGTTTIEGGTVIKFGNHLASRLVLNGRLNCLTGIYRPAILTSRDDDSTGALISEATGNPGGNVYATYLIDAGGQTNDYKGLRIQYAGTGISGANPVNIWDCQFMHGGTAILCASNLPIALHNVLISGMSNCVSSAGSVTAEFLTADQCQNFCPISYAGGYLTNCLLTALANTNGISLTAGVSLTNGASVYQACGGGEYYLAPGTYQAQGSNNINPLVLADIAKKTTWPPFVYNITGLYYSSNLNLSPRAWRDTNSMPDLGYHYDPLDYVFGPMYVTNASIVINAGTALGVYGGSTFGYAVCIANNASFLCLGTATSMVHIVGYNTVQEAGFPSWREPWYASVCQFAGSNSSINCQFTDWSALGQDFPHLQMSSSTIRAIQFQ